MRHPFLKMQAVARRATKRVILACFPWLRHELRFVEATPQHHDLSQRHERLALARALLDEAEQCLALGLPTQAAVSCRAAMDQALAAFLSGKARKLGTATQLYLVGPRHGRFGRPLANQLAHLTRDVGNKAAHGRRPAVASVERYHRQVTWLLHRLEQFDHPQGGRAASQTVLPHPGENPVPLVADLRAKRKDV